ncbi:RNA polymerase sigma-70 factor [Sunxiuqinia dokdonensis]|uniref:HTH luxR-type domain-containing protein n=1 Tax=Sunxiuqinia dokdonensis TaxID=1409788 RepID=A0A0L8V9W8_9BACT|nr:RNA polymerase sigma-70 factor [Sunxiuqinia dokdonensis]KOH45007.1 hypothetical protein NC99_21320 [Sunxiuqinia dokdonensis]
MDLTKSSFLAKEKNFRVVFMTYFESLEVFAKAYVADEEVAKDITQEVFANLWAKKTSLPPQINLKSYLYQATRNNCLNYLKRLKIRSKYEKRARDNYQDLLLNHEALSQLNFDELSYQELVNSLSEAISELPPKCREVFELSRFDGMKNKEIADHLNISIKAVESHISKALKTLKSKLKPHYPASMIFFILSERPIANHKKNQLFQIRN